MTPMILQTQGSTHLEWESKQLTNFTLGLFEEVNHTQQLDVNVHLTETKFCKKKDFEDLKNISTNKGPTGKNCGMDSSFRVFLFLNQ